MSEVHIGRSILIERCSDVVVSVAGVGDLSGLRCFVVGVNRCVGEVSSPVAWLASVELIVLVVADGIDAGRIFCVLRSPLVRVVFANSPVWVLNLSSH